MVGWRHRLDGHEFEQALGVGEGQGGLACCRPWVRKESDVTEGLNCTELYMCWTLFIFGCAEFFLLCGLSSSFSDLGLLSSCSVQASLLSENELEGMQASVVVGHGLRALQHVGSS